MSRKMLLILGAGGHGKSVAEAAVLSGDWQTVVFVDDQWPSLSQCFGWPVISDIAGLESVADRAAGAIAAVGNNKVREDWSERLEKAGLPLISVIHPRACVSAAAVIGPGCAIMAQAMVGVEAVIGRGAIINASASVDHDAYVGDFGHLGVGVQLAGGVRVGARAWLQAGSCAGYRVLVEEGAVLEPGSVLSA